MVNEINVWNGSCWLVTRIRGIIYTLHIHINVWCQFFGLWMINGNIPIDSNILLRKKFMSSFDSIILINDDPEGGCMWFSAFI